MDRQVYDILNRIEWHNSSFYKEEDKICISLIEVSLLEVQGMRPI